MRKVHKLISIGLVLVVALSVGFTGCSQRPEGDEPDTSVQNNDSTKTNDSSEKASNGKETNLTVYLTPTEQANQNALNEIAGEFEKQNPGINVNINFPGQEYENILKIKMAANDLPDVFDTHGWAIIRYGKYLEDLRDQSWVPDLTDSIKNVVTDKDGKVHCLVLTEAKDGLVYNEDVLNKYSIEIPKTIDELILAGEKIKKDSNGEVTPFYFSGIDSWMIGQYFDEFATSLLISPKDNSASALLDGSFDWSKWNSLALKLKEIHDKGLMNEDVLTAKYSDLAAKFAEGKVAFGIMGLGIAEEVKNVNPDAKMGMMPVPAWTSDDEPNFSGGERWTMGVWKDTKYMDEAKKLVDFYAQKDNMTKFANITKLPAGLKGVTAEHEYAKYYDQYSNIRVFPYFDRVYLPNGMWDVMCKSGTQLIAGQITPEQQSETMKKEVERLMNK